MAQIKQVGVLSYTSTSFFYVYNSVFSVLICTYPNILCIIFCYDLNNVYICTVFKNLCRKLRF